MAGHSKWANIQHRKGAQDKKRSKIFSKLSKEITIAARLGDPDPEANPRLRLAVNNAKAQSMPKDNIQRAIQKAVGSDKSDLFEIGYEGFGPGGCGIIVEVSTDNKNRAAAEIRTAFSKNGGNLGETGCVSHQFENVGQIVYPLSIGGEEEVLEAVLESGAEDMEHDEENYFIYSAREDLSNAVSGLQEQFGDPSSAGLIWRPQLMIEVEGDKVPVLLKLMEVLDDLDDVQNVFANFDISDEAMAAAS